MSDNWNIQVSPKIGDTLVNLRAETPAQMDDVLGWFEQNSARIASVVEMAQAAGNVGKAFAGPGTGAVPPQQPQQQAPSWSQQGSQQAPQQQGGSFGPPPTKWDMSGPPSQPPMCPHGPMEWRHRKSKAGNIYKGWFCKAPQSDCSPEYVKD